MTLRGWEPGALRFRRSLASRVTLLTTMAVALAVTVVSLAAYAVTRYSLEHSADQSLLSRAQALSKTPDIANKLLSPSSSPVYVSALGAADIRVGLVDPDATPHFASRRSSFPVGGDEAEVARRELKTSTRTVGSGGDRFRVVAVPALNGGGEDVALAVAQSLDSQDDTLNRLGIVTFLVGLLGVLVAALAGMAVARSGLRPVRWLTRRVEEAARTDDLTPLRLEGDDEVARLGAAFNSLLASVAASRHRQRQLVADAGHELRTPLTSLRTNLDLLAMADEGHGLPPEARAELLGDVRAQLEELSTLIGDLVELARDEPTPVVVEPVDLADVVERSVRRVRRRAPSVGFDTALSPWIVEGESSALERAVTNLLDNAAKWSPPGGRVEIRLVEGVLTVADQGPGIPAADLPHVFDRFYRATESRSMPGSGLGLSIVRQVAERHGGTVRADTGPTGGALLTLRLPTVGGRGDPPPTRPDRITFGRSRSQA